MACFDIDIGHLLITLSSLSLAFAFVFGNSLKTVYESVVFLFVIRPYQVGHFIVYKGNMHTVKNFGLLSTQLLRYDGRRIWVWSTAILLAPQCCSKESCCACTFRCAPISRCLHCITNSTCIRTHSVALRIVKSAAQVQTVQCLAGVCHLFGVQVPNETLMSTDIINVTSSRNIIDRISFEVDIDKMHPVLCADLEERMRGMMEQEEPRRLFNRNFPPNSYIQGFSNPLKYKVCAQDRKLLSLGTNPSLKTLAILIHSCSRLQ